MTPEETLLAEALTHHDAQAWQEADAAYKRLTSRYPTWAPGLWNYARMLHSFPNDKQAVGCAAYLYRQVLVAPGEFTDIKAEAYNGLGTIMLAWGEDQKAIGCFQHTLALNPKHPHAPTNLGVARRLAGDLAGAENVYRMVLAADPTKPEAHHEAAHIRLTMGDLKGGFQEYEWRWKNPNFISARMDQLALAPRWEGEALDGKTIMLPYEQGFGDAIMFIRYARLIKERWPAAAVWAWVTPELVRLIECAEGVDKAFNSHEPIPDTFDYYCPLLSLPRIFGTTLESIPCGPYIDCARAPLNGGLAELRDARELKDNRPVPARALHVGIVWAGRPEHAGDKWRSTALADWKDILSVDGVQFHSFQMWKAKEQLVDAPNVIDATIGVNDFRDTAERLHSMDLLIAVDTAMVHLAGAMGKEVWTLIPYSPDWRWMLSGERTPWYKTMTLFRQTRRGDWAPVLQTVKEKLTEYVERHTTTGKPT